MAKATENGGLDFKILMRTLQKNIILLLIAIVAVFACKAERTFPDIKSMPEKEIKRYAESLTIKELKIWADSLYFPADSKAEIREKAEILYKELMQRAMVPLSADDEKTMARGYSNYATYLIFDKNDPVQAYPLLRQSLELMEKYKDDGLLVVGAYTNMAHLYANFNDTKRALRHLEKGLKKSQESSEPKRGGYIYSQLLLMAWEADMLSEIRPVMQEFKKSPGLKGGKLYKVNVEHTKAAEAYLEGDYATASRHLEESTKHIDADFDKEIYLAMTKLMLADTYLRANDTELARKTIDEAERILDGYNELNGNEFLIRIKARYYRTIGREDLARECELREYELRDSLYSARNMTTISDLEQDMVTTKYTAELRESQLRQEVLQEKNKRQRVVIIIIGITAIIIITLLLTLIVKGRRLNEARYDLIRKDVDLSLEKRKHAQTEKDAPEAGAEEETIKEPADNETESLSAIFGTICDFMYESKEIYEPGFSIEQMSETLGLSVRQISRAINLHSNKNFSLFLSGYRIREACRILLEDTPGIRPTIEQVAERVGYRSRSHFSRTFKTVTGLTTTEFLRQKEHRP
ncbi:MAG: helix-turn-helix domain-containing protein [Muribaculaceae bacterium]|nr:helix-turn-helix domain-containing protein [Muribaculaceae bacterium]